LEKKYISVSITNRLGL